MLDKSDIEKVDYWIAAQFRGAKCNAWNRIKTALAELGTTPNTGSPKLLDRLEEVIDSARWVGINRYVECKEIIKQLRAGA